MTRTCIPGASKTKARAAKMRSFAVPEEFHENLTHENSKDKGLRRANIFFALVSADHAWLLLDFARLVQYHVISRDEPFRAEEFLPTSSVSTLISGVFVLLSHPRVSQTWPSVWSAFPTGPDWIHELEDAKLALDAWRAEVCGNDSRDRDCCIIDVMGDADTAPFNSFGRHTIIDFLHHVHLDACAPASWICDSDSRYEHFKEQIPVYMGQLPHGILHSPVLWVC